MSGAFVVGLLFIAVLPMVLGLVLILFCDAVAKTPGLKVIGFDSGDKSRDVRSAGWLLLIVGSVLLIMQLIAR